MTFFSREEISMTNVFVRNSWGAKRGENGNYYMTDDYLNGTYTDPKTKTQSNILKYYYGYKPQ
jgi:C1A family cysteine protease